MLVKHSTTEEVKLVIIKIDPWKPIESGEPFDLPETIFVVEGNVAPPPKSAKPREYSSDKIRQVQML